MPDFTVAGALGNHKGARVFAGRGVMAEDAETAIHKAMAEEGVWFAATEVKEAHMIGAELQIPPRKDLDQNPMDWCVGDKVWVRSFGGDEPFAPAEIRQPSAWSASHLAITYRDGREGVVRSDFIARREGESSQ